MSIDFDWGDDNWADEVFHVMCQVSGGMMGTRVSILKDAGEPVVFHSREEAQDAADRYNKTMNNEYSTASFKYWVIEA